MKSTHWADITADKIIRERGEKEHYTCASGITPSGTVHVGNFREIISVELVARALKQRGENVRFIYSWDDYDVFRKVPKNMPKQELLESYLRKSIDIVPDVIEEGDSFARYNEVQVERILPTVGIHPEYIYQSKKYRASDYAQGMRTALEKEAEIRAALNEHRSSDLAPEWKPVSVFCTACEKDTTKLTGWNKEWNIDYSCECGHKETLDLRKTGAAKLFWRIDWPMRWVAEDVDFEPAGKEHHSAGGSFDTSKVIVETVFGGKPPVTFKYDFVRLKGGGGKLSSSTGEVVTLKTVLEIFQPEIVRFLFAGTRPNAEFAISFDLDVLKIYEDYDKCERTYFNKPETEKALKKWEKQARIYELCQIDDKLENMPKELPYQIPIRHLCNLLQINAGDIDAVIAYLGDVDSTQEPRLRQKATCAWNWVNQYAPEDFRFALRPIGEKESVEEKFIPVLQGLAKLIDAEMNTLDEKEFSTKFYAIMEENNVESGDFFPVIYKILMNKEKGPRLINFLYTIGKEKASSILGQY